MVFYGIVCSAREVLSNNSPFVSVMLMGSKQFLLFMLCPVSLVDIGVEMIVPTTSFAYLPLSTLFARST